MTPTQRTPILLCLLALAFGARSGIAQNDFSKEEQELSLKASRKLQETATRLDQKSVEELGEDARELVRKSPAAAVGLAALAGFLLARLLRR